MPRRSRFDIALEVLRETKIVRNWVLSELRFMEVDVNSPEAKKLIENLKDKYARMILQ